MDGDAEMVRFGTRLEGLLSQHEPPLTQAWLAERSGLDRSLISRYVSGDRLPTAEALQCLAPVFKLDVSDLVRGTNAEQRGQEAGLSFRQENRKSVVEQMIEYESRCRELENQLRATREAQRMEETRRNVAEQNACVANLQRERAERDLAEYRQKLLEQEQELRKYRLGLSRALERIDMLREKLQEVTDELKKAKRSSDMSAIFAGVAAAASAVTLTQLLSGDGKGESSSTPKARSSSPKQRRNRA